MGLKEGLSGWIYGNKVIKEPERGIAVSDTLSMFGIPVLPIADLDAFESLYKTDQGYVKAAIDFWRDTITGVGFYTTVKDRENEPYKIIIDDFCEKVNFDKFISRVCQNTLIYGFCPVIKQYDSILVVPDTGVTEGIKISPYKRVSNEQTKALKIQSKGKLIGLKILPSTNFAMVRDKYGNVLKYIQQINVGGKQPEYAPDEIWLCQWNVVGTDAFGISLLSPIFNAINIKKQAISDMGKIIQRYGAPKVVWFVPTDKDRKELSGVLDKLPINKDPIISGDAKITPLQVDPRAAFEFFYDFLDKEIFEGLGAPLLSYLRNSTQASANQMMDKVSREVQGIQRYLKREIEAQIFKELVGDAPEIPRLNWGAPQTGLEEIKILDIARLVEVGSITPLQSREMMRKLGIPLEEASGTPTGSPTANIKIGKVLR